MPDIINERAFPALATTTDMPSGEAAAAPTPAAEKAAPAKAVDEKAQPADKSATVDEHATDEPAAGADKKGAGDEIPAWQKARLSKADNRAKQAEAAAKDAQVRLDKALAALEKVTAPKPETPKDDPRPSREYFDTPDAYDNALEDWAGRRAAATAVQQDAQKRQHEAVKAEAESQIATYNARRATFVTDHADYAEVVEADDVQFTPALTIAIVNDEDGPAVAYHLAKNPDELERLSKMNVAQASAAVGRLATRLAHTPAPAKPTPMKPVGSRQAPVKTTEGESMEDYGRRREAELRTGKRN